MGRNFNKTVIMLVFRVVVIRCTLVAQFVGGQNAEFITLNEVAHIVIAVLHCRCSVVFSAFDKQ